jgi:hypothetical protein
MSISTPSCTDGAVAQIRYALTTMRASDVDLWPAEEVLLSGAIPLYEAGFKAEKALSLRSLRLTGYRHLIFEDGRNEPAFVAELRPADRDGGKVASVTRPPPGLMKLLRIAETISEDSDFQLSIAVIPAAYSTAIWLRGKYHLFIYARDRRGVRVVGPEEYFDGINAVLAGRQARWEAHKGTRGIKGDE